MAPKCQVRWSELIHTHCLCVRYLQQKSTECVKASRLDFPLPRETEFLICPSAAICTLKGNTPSPAVIKRPSMRLCRCLAGPCSEHGGGMGIASTNENDKALVKDKFSVRPGPCTVSRKIRTCQMQSILIHFDNPSWSLNPYIPYWLKESKESQRLLLSLVAANPSCLLGGKSCFCQQVIWRIPSSNLPGDAASLQWQCMAMRRGYMLNVSTCYTFLFLLTFFLLFFSSSVILYIMYLRISLSLPIPLSISPSIHLSIYLSIYLNLSKSI